MKIIYQFPSNINASAGGTRNKIVLNRPWHVPVRVDRDTCPFSPENLKEEEVIARYRGGDWIVITNLYTPHSFHRMLIPRECWGKEVLWELGGLREIVHAMSLLDRVVEGCESDLMHASVHSGYLAGQTISHLHYHIFDPTCTGDTHSLQFEKESLKKLRDAVESDTRIIFRHERVTVAAGGHRAGQCYLFADGNFDPSSFGEALYRLLILYAKKFKSIQGDLPDYGIGLVFEKGMFHHGVFVPVLNNWGAIDYAALAVGGAVALPWPHEATATYLRS